MRNQAVIRLGPSGDGPFVLHSTGHVHGRGGDGFAWPRDRVLLVETVIKGKGRVTVGDSNWQLEADDTYVLYDVHAHYASDCAEPWSKVFFVASGPLVDSLVPMYLKHQCIFAGSETRELMCEMHALTARATPDAHVRASRLFVDLMIRLSGLNVARAYPEQIQKCLDFIDGNFERPISVEGLARQVFMSRAHLARLFRKHVGVTPYEYVIQRRMDAAIALLSNSSLRIREIADRLSFADEFYFSNSFKKRVGVAPSSFRRAR